MTLVVISGISLLAHGSSSVYHDTQGLHVVWGLDPHPPDGLFRVPPLGGPKSVSYHILRMYPGSTDPGIWRILELRCQGIWGPMDPMDPVSWLAVTHWIRVSGTPLNHGSWVWGWSHMGYPRITHLGCFGDPYLVHSGMSPSCRYRIQVLDSGRLGMVPQMSHLGVPTPTGGTLQMVGLETPFGRSQTMVYHILRIYPGSTDPGIWRLLELRSQGI